MGDENSRFFHRFLVAKKRRNLISKLLDDQDKLTNSFRDIENIILNFYMSLYLKLPSAGSFPTNLEWAIVSETPNTWPVSRFILEEIHKALKLLAKNKAPGPLLDTAEFFLKFWEHFKDNFKSLFEDFFDNEKLNACVKEDFICLIKKQEDVVRVRDFRPISLTNLAYKIVVKVLAE